MKKFSRLLSAILAVVLIFGLVPMTQFTAVAADTPTLSLNVVSETNNEVKISINLESGSFLALDVGLVVKNSGLTCTGVIDSDELFDFASNVKKTGNQCVSAAYDKTLKCSVATTTPFNVKAPIFVYTFKKATSTKVIKADVELKCTSLKDGSGNVVNPVIVNNIRVSADVLPAPSVSSTNVSSSGKIKVSWTAVSGAAKYKVYRTTSKTGKYKLIYTTTSTSFTNTSVTPGTTYYYKVRAVENDGTSGKLSKYTSRTCDYARPVVQISGLYSTGKNKVSWNKVDGATKYKVYRATSEKGTYKLVKTTTSLSYTNTSAVAGKTYYYKVKAVGTKSAADSAYSKVVSRTCKLPRTTVSVSLTSKGNPQVTWTKVNGAVKYKVYRSTTESGSYKLLKTTTDLSFVNTSVVSGTTYYYKVVAVHSNTAANSAYSKPASIKVVK